MIPNRWKPRWERDILALEVRFGYSHVQLADCAVNTPRPPATPGRVVVRDDDADALIVEFNLAPWQQVILREYLNPPEGVIQLGTLILPPRTDTSYVLAARSRFGRVCRRLKQFLS